MIFRCMLISFLSFSSSFLFLRLPVLLDCCNISVEKEKHSDLGTVVVHLRVRSGFFYLSSHGGRENKWLTYKEGCLEIDTGKRMNTKSD